jgi:hypothetical protein
MPSAELSFQVLACVQRLSNLACAVVDSHALRRALFSSLGLRPAAKQSCLCGCGFPCPPYSLALGFISVPPLLPLATLFHRVEFPDPSAFEHSLSPGWTWFCPPIIPDSSDVLFIEPTSPLQCDIHRRYRRLVPLPPSSFSASVFPVTSASPSPPDSGTPRLSPHPPPRSGRPLG